MRAKTFSHLALFAGIIGSLASPGHANAQPCAGTPSGQMPPGAPSAYLNKKSGQPIYLCFADGREAILKKTSFTYRFDIPFTIDENTCNDQVGASCKYTVPFAVDYFFFAWSKNPDASKLGHELTVPQSGGAPQPVEFTAFATSIQRKSKYAGLPEVASVPAETISCSNFEWFPPNDPAHPGARIVRELSSEQDLTNAETAVMENRLATTAHDVTFAPAKGNSVEVTGVLSPPAVGDDGNNTAALIFTSDSAWYVKSPRGDVCQFTARGPISSTLQDQGNLIATKRPPAEQEKTVYTYGNTPQDGLYQIDMNLPSLVTSVSGGAQ